MSFHLIGRPYSTADIFIRTWRAICETNSNTVRKAANSHFFSHKSCSKMSLYCVCAAFITQFIVSLWELRLWLILWRQEKHWHQTQNKVWHQRRVKQTPWCWGVKIAFHFWYSTWKATSQKLFKIRFHNVTSSALVWWCCNFICAFVRFWGAVVICNRDLRHWKASFHGHTLFLDEVRHYSCDSWHRRSAL